MTPHVNHGPESLSDRKGEGRQIGLFIPCYIDAFLPEVGIATLELLEKLGCSVEYPLQQTCCGQPMANSGCQDDSAATEALFVDSFKDFNTIVPVGLDQLEEVVEVVVQDVGVDQFLALPIHHADIDLARVQIDSAVELRLDV